MSEIADILLGAIMAPYNPSEDERQDWVRKRVISKNNWAAPNTWHPTGLAEQGAEVVLNGLLGGLFGQKKQNQDFSRQDRLLQAGDIAGAAMLNASDIEEEDIGRLLAAQEPEAVIAQQVGNGAISEAEGQRRQRGGRRLWEKLFGNTKYGASVLNSQADMRQRDAQTATIQPESDAQIAQEEAQTAVHWSEKWKTDQEAKNAVLQTEQTRLENEMFPGRAKLLEAQTAGARAQASPEEGGAISKSQGDYWRGKVVPQIEEMRPQMQILQTLKELPPQQRTVLQMEAAIAALGKLRDPGAALMISEQEQLRVFDIETRLNKMLTNLDVTSPVATEAVWNEITRLGDLYQQTANEAVLGDISATLAQNPALSPRMVRTLFAQEAPLLLERGIIDENGNYIGPKFGEGRMQSTEKSRAGGSALK